MKAGSTRLLVAACAAVALAGPRSAMAQERIGPSVAASVQWTASALARPATIEARVLDAGTGSPVPYAEVVSPAGAVIADSTGRFVLSAPDHDTVALEVSARGRASAHARVAAADGRGVLATLALERAPYVPFRWALEPFAPPLTVAGRVVRDDGGAPVPGATIDTDGEGSARGADANGWFHRTFRDSVTIPLRADAPGFRPVETSVHPSPDGGWRLAIALEEIPESDCEAPGCPPGGCGGVRVFVRDFVTGLAPAVEVAMSVRQGARLHALSSDEDGAVVAGALTLGLESERLGDGPLDVALSAEGYLPWSARVRRLGAVPCVPGPAAHLGVWLLPDR